jgi:hypothetical protein
VAPAGGVGVGSGGVAAGAGEGVVSFALSGSKLQPVQFVVSLLIDGSVLYEPRGGPRLMQGIFVGVPKTTSAQVKLPVRFGPR